MPSELISVTLFRKPEQDSWGFGLVGGIEDEIPLTISEVLYFYFYYFLDEPGKSGELILLFLCHIHQILIFQIHPATIAAKVGLRVGDKLIEINKKEVADFRYLLLVVCSKALLYDMFNILVT